MQSFKLAWLTDIVPDERERGITIDNIEKIVTINNKEYLFVDTPGHKYFILNAL